jgi:multiple sugar transport system permease protein
VVIPGIWAASGPGCIIYLAALKTVPEELVEAASIDGAGILQKICYITLPRIKFLILIQLIGAIVSAFKGGTNVILAMTGGGPPSTHGGATMVLGMDIFQRTYMELQYGTGAAMAWFLGGLVIVLTAYQLKRMSRAEFKTATSTDGGRR